MSQDPDPRLDTILEGLAFPECPRWHGGRLWFSDMHNHTVHAMTTTGQVTTVTEVPGQPGGIGWLPDGTLQIVSMTDRRVLRLNGDRLVEVADLSSLASFNCNDMITDSAGRAYVGNYGFDLDGGAKPATTNLCCIDEDGSPWVVAEGLLFPNGMVITPTGTLIVAESFGQRLSCYDIRPDGSLTNPHVWQDLAPNVPDGICLDADGAVWIADPVNKGVARVVSDRGAVEWISTGERGAYACWLGGNDLRTLYVCTARTSDPTRTVEQRSGRICAVRVDVPGALAA